MLMLEIDQLLGEIPDVMVVDHRNGTDHLFILSPLLLDQRLADVTCPRLLYHIPCESRRIAAPEVPWPREPAGDCPTRCAGESGCRCAASVR